MAENQWMEYIQQVLDKMDFNSGEYTETGVTNAAAIYGLDGSAWAWSPNFPELSSYEFPLEDMSGAVTNIPVNEIECAIKASEGIRNPTDAGIRLGNEKFMFVAFDADAQVVQLSKRGGGGCAIGRMNTAMILAFWVKDHPKSPSGVQTAGQCAEQVQIMCEFLKGQGY